MHGLGSKQIVVALGVLLAAPGAVLADGGGGAAVATTPHFAFYSDFSTNLNDALVVAGAARKRGEPELFGSGSEAESCFAELPGSARAGWNLAVDYYAQIVSPAGWMGRQQFLLRFDLADFDDELDERTRTYAGIAEGFRAAAAPAYRACRWPAQDAGNRRWIDGLTRRLAVHQDAIGKRLERLYGTSWHGLPIRFDIVPTAPYTGANTWSEPPHIQASSTITDGDALEIAFHEASHTLMRPEDPIQRALADAARELGMDEPPGDLWHVVLFYTTGQAVRRVLEEAGEPRYTPYIDGHDLWRGRWGAFRAAIETTWPGYLNGDRTLAEAAGDLLRALEEPAPDEPDEPGR
jgi:hypothetical protein